MKPEDVNPDSIYRLFLTILARNRYYKNKIKRRAYSNRYYKEHKWECNDRTNKYWEKHKGVINKLRREKKYGHHRKDTY